MRKKLDIYRFLFFVVVITLTNIKANATAKDTIFHTERKINFKIYESGRNIVIDFNTEQKQMVKLLEQLGLKVYFDEKMKKKEDVFIHYPIGSRTEIGLEEEEQKKLQAEMRNKEIDYRLIISNIEDDAEYGYMGNEQIFNILLNSLEVSSKIYMDDNDVFHYRLKVPKRLINPDNPDKVNAFSLGLESGTIPVKRRQQTANMTNRRMRGMANNRRRGGMGRRGLQQANTRTITINRSPLEIWFDVKF